MRTDTLAIVRAIGGDFEARGTYSENTRAIIGAIHGDTFEFGPIGTETAILCKAFGGNYDGADSRLSTNGRAIVRALQGDCEPRATVSSDTREIIRAICGGGSTVDPNSLVTESGEVVTTESGEPIVLD